MLFSSLFHIWHSKIQERSERFTSIEGETTNVNSITKMFCFLTREQLCKMVKNSNKTVANLCRRSSLGPTPLLVKPCIFLDYWQKETSLLHHLQTGRKRRGRCSHTVDIYTQNNQFISLKLALEHTTAKELLLWRPCTFRPGLWYGLLIHTLTLNMFIISP